MLISSIAGKRVYSKEGVSLGYARYAALNKARTRLACIVCADENEDEFILSARALVSLGDAIVVKNTAASDASIAYPCPLYAPVYTDGGDYMGTVRDIILEADGSYLLLDTGAKYSVTGARFGQAIILKTQKNSAPKQTEKSEKTVKTKTIVTQKTALAADFTQEETPMPASPAIDTRPYTTANGLDRVNLLGRKPKKSVYANDGTPLILAGEQITTETIAHARRENLLLRLTMNTLTNL